MKCDKCGYQASPGDQICLNCGNKLALTAISTIEDIEKMNQEVKPEVVEKKQNKKLLFIIIGSAIAVVIVAVILCLVFLR